MKMRVTILSIVVCFFINANAQGTWTAKANVTSIGRWAAAAFSIGNSGYVTLGQDASGVFKNDLWEYSPSLNTWTQKANFSGISRYSTVSFSIGSKGYVGVGQTSSGTFLNDFWEYDPITNVWLQKANFPGQGRYGAMGLSIGNAGYLGLGWNISTYFNDFWEYTPSLNIWVQKSNYPGLGRVECGSFCIGNLGYIGSGSNPCSVSHNDFWEYNPKTDSWIAKTNIPGISKQNPVCFTLCNRGYFALGDHCGPPYNTDGYEYDPIINQWTPITNFPAIGRDNPIWFSINNKGYAGTGQNNVRLNDFWEFTPSNNQCSILLTTNKTNVLCNGGHDGLAVVNVSGGSAPYVYLWSNGATTSSISNLSAGEYTVTVTDNTGSTAIISTTITEPSSLVINTTINNTSCNFSNGSISATINGGVSPYTYNWSNGVSTPNISGLSAGTYSLMVTDANGCSVASSLIQVSIQPLSKKDKNVWYFGNNAGLNFNSGTPVALTDGAMFTYDNSTSVADENTGALLFYSNGVDVWNKNHVIMPNGSGLLGHTSGGNSAFAVKQPGNASVYYLFTMDAFAGGNGLRYSIIDMSLQGGLGDVTSSKNILLLNPSTEKITAVRHANQKDIWIITHPWNSNTFHAYLLTGSGLATAPVISTIGSTHSGGTLGTYNAMGQISCSPKGNKIAVAIYDLQQYELFDFDNNTGLLSNLIQIAGYSNAWGVEFSPDGKKLYTSKWKYSALYQFDISSNNQTMINNSAILIGNATSPDPTYKAGYLQAAPDGKIYIAKFTSNYLGVINSPNALGLSCNFVDNGIYLAGKVSEAGLPSFMQTYINSCPLSIHIISKNVLCNADNKGYATAVTANGVAPYTYLWSNGATVDSISNLSAGIYSVVVTDNVGATASASVTITEPASLVVNTVINNPTCNSSNGSISANVNGGVPGYTYDWSNGATTQIISGISAGVYSLIVKDANNCSVSSIDTIGSLDNIKPTAICKNVIVYLDSSGSASITAADVDGGSFDNCGIVNMQVSQNKFDCDGSKNILFSVEDASGNMSTCTTLVLVKDSISPVLICPSDIHVSTCNPQVFWNNVIVKDNCSTTLTSTHNSGDYFPLGKTNVTYTAVDSFGNSSSCSFNVFVHTDSLLTSISSSNVSCNGASDGTVSVNVTGGCSPYSYLWSNGITSSSVSSLSAGIYSVTITDNAGLVVSATTTITQPAILVVDAVVNNGNCNANNGTISLNVNGGVSPYNYKWSNGASISTISGLSAGTYTVIVTDANGCTASVIKTITTSSAIIVDAGANQTVYDGYSPNSCVHLNGTGSGGVLPYSYEWSTGATTKSIKVCPTSNKQYTLTITDAQGCFATDVVKVCVLNIRCNKVCSNSDKVEICHVMGNGKTQTLCVAAPAVPAHLAHGDQLGACGVQTSCEEGYTKETLYSDIILEEMGITAYPNPFLTETMVRFNVMEQEQVEVGVYNILGIKVATLFDGIIEGMELYETKFVADESLPNGIYFLKIITSKGDMKVVRVLLSK